MSKFLFYSVQKINNFLCGFFFDPWVIYQNAKFLSILPIHYQFSIVSNINLGLSWIYFLFFLFLILSLLFCCFCCLDDRKFYQRIKSLLLYIFLEKSPGFVSLLICVLPPNVLKIFSPWKFPNFQRSRNDTMNSNISLHFDLTIVNVCWTVCFIY